MMKKGFIYRNSLALLLALLLIMGALPLQVIALDTSTPDTSSTQSTSSASSEYIVDSQETVSDELIGEVAEEISLREENVKHFRLSNGMYQAIVYPSPVHRKDQNGAWQDIDNRLVTVESVGTKLLQTPDSRVSFASAFKANESLFTLSENGYSVEMALLAAPLSGGLSADATATLGGEATVTNAPSRPAIFDSIEQAARIDNRSSVLYQSVMPNTSIEYILKGNDVKENIIVSAPSGSYEYDFELTLEGLTATLDKKGNVRLCDTETGASRYVIPAPYMYDADGVYSEAVSYELYTVKDGLYLLRVSADATWINAADRAFPVTIDPTLIQDTPACDSYTDANVPDGAYGYEEDIWVSDHQTAYFCLSSPSLPSGAFLTEARLYISYYFPNVTTGEMLVGAYQVLESWDEWDISYNNAPAIGTETLDTSVLIAIAATTSGLTSFDITDAALDWVENSFSNYGIAIKRQESAEYTNTSVLLRSYEANPDEDAYIALTYTHYVPNGVYAFRNIGSSANTKWMSVEGGSVWAGSHMQRSYFPDSPKETNVFDRTGLFKISRVGDTDRYIIRLMVNNNLTFGISGTEVITKEIPSADADVAAADTFNIEWTGQGYYISPYGSTSVIRMRATSANLTIVAETEAAANFDAVWGLEQYTGLHRQGSSIYYTDPLTVGTTVTITPIVWATNIGFNTPELSVLSGYTDKASCTWDESTRTGALALHDDGTLKIRCHIYDGDHISDRTTTYNLYPSLVVEEGLYFIKNHQVGEYVQIHHTYAPSYSAENATIELQDRDIDRHETWTLTHISDGYYTIISGKSEKALSVPSSSLNSGVVPLEQSTSTCEPDDRQQWRITKTARETYVFRAKSGEQSTFDWCMSVRGHATSTNPGTIVYSVNQGVYSDDAVYIDEWDLELLIYGVQPFREIDEDDWENINCHGYAMMRDDIPEDWLIETSEYISQISPNDRVGNNDYSQSIKVEIAEATKEDFENWLSLKNYNFVYEEDYTRYGSGATLAPNQYRIVLRTGFHNIHYNGIILDSGRYDYHFWYQTYDGRWANKHGKTQPELLPSGTTPFSYESSGWSLTAIWEMGEIILDCSYVDFYDSPIYSYIITMD